MKLTKGSRIAEIKEGKNGVTVYCGFEGSKNCPGEETIPSRFFNGTCSKTFKTLGGANRAAGRFLNE